MTTRLESRPCVGGCGSIAVPVRLGLCRQCADNPWLVSAASKMARARVALMGLTTAVLASAVTLGLMYGG